MNSSVKSFEPMVQEEMSFNDICYLQLWWPFRSTESNGTTCANGRGPLKVFYSTLVTKMFPVQLSL